MGDDPHEKFEDPPPLHKYALRVAFQVFHEGRLTISSVNAGTQPMSGLSHGFATVTLSDHSKWRVFATRGNEDDVQVYVGEHIKARRSILWAVLRGVLMPLICALPLLAVVGWMAVRHGLGPLRLLSRALAQRQPRALDAIVLTDVPSEIAPVVHSLNALLDRIGQMMVLERQFTADAAHELRTPIAAIRAQAQVALGAGGDIACREHALEYTLAGCDRATHLVEQLLTLSRLESSATKAPVSGVDAAMLAQQVAADLALVALRRQQVLELLAPAPALVRADPTLTCVLMRNLIDNAMRYSPEGARIVVTVAVAVGQDGRQTILQVEDSGPGLVDAEMARLGERFYRVPGTSQTGSGLGWSIVKRIAAVYQAQVQVSRSNLLGGLCVKVLWSSTS